MTTAIDWDQLARQLGLLREGRESSNSAAALEAIEIIVGTTELRTAVDHYISKQPGYELARAVLWTLHPWSSMQRCYEVYRSGASLDDRRDAIELLRVVADGRALAWFEEFLSDEDPVIRTWAVGIIDQLAWSGRVEAEELEKYLAMAERCPDEECRGAASRIRRLLEERALRDPGPPAMDR